MANIYADITRQGYKNRRGIDDYYASRKYSPQQGAGQGFKLASGLIKLGIEHFTTLNKNKELLDASMKDADSNFRQGMMKIGAGLDQESFKIFVNSQSDKMKEGMKLVQKYGSTHKKYQEGQDLITSANQAVETAHRNKGIWEQIVAAQQGKTLGNMDNTYSSESQNNVLTALNGTFLQQNQVFIDDAGNFMYEQKIDQQKIYSKKDQEEHQKNTRYVEGEHYYSDEATPATGGDIDGTSYTEGQPTVSIEGRMNLAAENEGNTYTVRPGVNGNPDVLVTTKRTNINDAPFAGGNLQLQENSLHNQVEKLSKLWEEKGYKQGVDGGQTSFGDDSNANEASDQEIRKKIRFMVDTAPAAEFASYVNNGVIELVFDETTGGETKSRTMNVHPAKVLLWHRGIDDPEMSSEQLVAAQKQWDLEKSVNVTHKGDPTDDKKDIIKTYTNEKDYEAALMRYNLAEMEFAQNGELTKKDRDIIKEVMFDNVKARNKVGHDKYIANEKEKQNAINRQKNSGKVYLGLGKVNSSKIYLPPEVVINKVKMVNNSEKGDLISGWEGSKTTRYQHIGNGKFTYQEWDTEEKRFKTVAKYGGKATQLTREQVLADLNVPAGYGGASATKDWDANDYPPATKNN
jgi:hypothetical protein